MKRFHLVAVTGGLWLCSILVTLGQAAAVMAEAEVVTVVKRGPHQKVIQNLRTVVDENGTATVHTNIYTHLGTGLSYQNEKGEWQDAIAEFEIFPGGAIARRTQHQVTLGSNPNVANAVNVIMPLPDQQRLVSHCLGLSYYDTAIMKSVMIAEIKDSQGELLLPGKNQVLYRNAFDGDGFSADLRYTISLAGLEQDVIISGAQPPSPEDYGMDPATTRLEVITEFTDSPQPIIEQRVLKAADPDKGQPEIVDQFVRFPTMQIRSGTVFGLAAEDPDAPSRPIIPVMKNWTVIEGRTVLFEAVQWTDVEPLLRGLPPAQQANADVVARKRAVAATTRALPTRRLAATSSTNELLMAQTQAVSKGIVIDYNLLNSTFDTFTFQGDTTYFNSSGTYLTGTTTLEAGAVIKFDGITWGNKIVVQGPLNCKTLPYRPAIFTGKDDDSVGEIISGSGGDPFSAGDYAHYAMFFDNPGAAITLEHVRVFNARYGLYFVQGGNHKLRHVQLIKCQYPLTADNCNVSVQNALITRATNALQISSAAIRAEHLTVHDAVYLTSGSGTNYLTNSLVVQVGYLGTWEGVNTYTPSSEVGVFQTVGGASHYLAANSQYRNAGAASAIDPNLLIDLKRMTTYPPELLTATVTVGTTLYPRAVRDTDAPDIGYHYDVLDYAAGGLNVTNVTLLLTNGVAVATHAFESIVLWEGAQLVSEGSPLNLNRLVRYSSVQEQATTNWYSSYPQGYRSLAIKGDTQIHLRFTELSIPGTIANSHIAEGFFGVTTLQDCQVSGGTFYFNSLFPFSGQTLSFQNCLFERVRHIIIGVPTVASTLNYFNNTFIGGSLSLYPTNSNQTWTAKDNLFDQTSIQNYTTGNLSFGNNGYVTGQPQLNPAGSGNVVLSSSPAYQSIKPNRFYIPNNSALIDAGSRTREAAGLYHYTVKSTSNSKEGTDTSTTVDIGYHYVGVDSNNQPKDSDGDDLADYFEDPEGNGSTDPGEQSWSNPVIALPGPTSTFNEGNAAVVLDATATVTDQDSAPSVNLNGGQLVLDFLANGNSFDQLAIQASGPVTLNTTASTISYNGTVVGGFTGGTGSQPLTVALNGSATFAAVQEIVRHATYKNISDNPTPLSKTVRFVLTTGDGARSAPAAKNVTIVPVNDKPVVSFSPGTTHYVPQSGPVIIDELASVNDVDSASFANQTLTIDYPAGGNGTADDRIRIRHTGYTAGQIGLRTSGTSTFVMYGGVDIGTLNANGGIGTTQLIITLNSSAAVTTEALRALLRSLTFTNTAGSPSLALRTIRAVLTDGTGFASTAKTKKIQLGCFDSLDVMLIIDRSGSMHDRPQENPAIFPLSDAKTAAKSFVDRLNSATDKAGLVSFADDTVLDQSLTANQTLLKSKIDSLAALGGTYMAQAIYQAQNELAGANHQASAAPVIIFLTDGRPQDGYDEVIEAAIAAKISGTRVITIGLGHLQADNRLLQEIASPNSSRPSGKDWYPAPSSTDLQGAFESIAYSICRVLAANQVNQPPTVNAGPDRVIRFNEIIDFGQSPLATASDPEGGSLGIFWSKVSGPGAVEFQNPTLLGTKATVVKDLPAGGESEPGLYVFRLTATDGQYTVSDDVNVYVFDDLALDPPPVVSGGPPQTVPVGQTVQLQGYIHNLGPTAITTSWSVGSHQLPGSPPPTITFADGTLTNTTASGFTVPGVYQLKLTATKSGENVSDSVFITACDQGENPADILLLIDRSGSMSPILGRVQEAAKAFVSLVNLSVHQVAIGSFYHEAGVDQPLTRDKRALDAAIDALPNLGGSTKLGSAIQEAHGELYGPRRNPAATPVLVLLTDGLPGDQTVAEATIKDAKLDGIVVITLGFGVAPASPEEDLLKNNLASSVQDYYGVTDTPALLQAYASIATSMCYGRTLPAIVDAGPDIVTASAQFTLAARMAPKTAQLTWTANPSTGISFSDIHALNPTVTLSSFVSTSPPITFTATAAVGSTSDADTVVVSYGNNAPPFARDDAFTGKANTVPDRLTHQILDVLRNDTDPNGDALHITSLSGESGQGTFDSATGVFQGYFSCVAIVANGKQLRMTPKADGTAGIERLIYTVTDDKGASSTAIVAIFMVPDNVPPRARDDGFTFQQSPPVTLSLLLNDSPGEGGSLSGWLWTDRIRIISVTPLPSGGKGTLKFQTGDTAGATVIYIPNLSQAPYTEGFSYTIQDRSGATSTANVTLIVKSSGSSANADPVVGAITAAPSATVPLDQWVTLQASVSDDGLPFVAGSPSTLEYAWTQVSGPGTAIFEPADDYTTTVTFDATGTYTLRLTASDAQPLSGNNNITINVTAANRLPEANILSLVDGDIVTSGLLKVCGIADDPDPGNTVNYTLEVFPVDQVNPPALVTQTVIGRVADTATHNPPYNQLGAPLDLSKLRNAVYDLRLSVSDGFFTVIDQRRFVLNTPLQLGRFTFSEEDFVIPINGIPITVVRTYDSFNQTSGEFGLSWTYAIKDMDVQLDEVRQQITDPDAVIAEDGTTFTPFYLRMGGGRDVALTMPDGRRVVFTHYIRLVPEGTHYAEWAPPPGVFATLIPLTSSGTSMNNRIIGFFTLTPSWAVTQGLGSINTPMENFDVPGFLLTTPEGTQYQIMRDIEGDGEYTLISGISVTPYGKPGLTRIIRPNGDTLTFNQFGVDHETATGVKTHSIVFKREGDAPGGRILEIRDQNRLKLNDPPLVKYTYTGATLTRVSKLVDKTNPSSPVWQESDYAYTTVNSLTYLQTITPVTTPPSQPLLRADYHTTTTANDSGRVGRLASIGTPKVPVTNPVTFDSTSFDYDTGVASGNKQQTVIDARGKSTTYDYDERGNITKTTFTLGADEYFVSRTYDENNNLLQEDDPAVDNFAFVDDTKYDYDQRGNVTAVTRHQNIVGNQSFLVTTFSYNKFGQVETTTDPLLKTTVNQYLANGNLSKSFDALGNPTSNTYTPEGYLSTVTDALNNSTTYLYDSRGNLTKITYPDGLFERFIYDDGERRIASFDRADRKTEYVYDELNRLRRTIYADGRFTTTDYDHVGRVQTTTDARGNAATFGYDAAGRRATVTDALQKVTQFFYDANGNLTKTKDPLLQETNFQYDDLNRRTQVIFGATALNPPTNVRTTGYDTLGRRIIEIDEAGVQTGFTYDSFGRLTAVTNAHGANDQTITEYGYDDGGRLITQTDANQRVTSYLHYDDGQLQKRTLPSGQFETFQYNAIRNLLQHTDFGGRTITHAYDSLSRLINKKDLSLPSGSQTLVSYTYTATGQRATMADPLGTTVYTYNNRDRLETKSMLAGVLTYTYDEDGRVLTLTSSNPGGANVAYQWDPVGRLEQVTDDGGTTVYNYFDTGNLQDFTYPNGVKTAFGYDPRNRLQSVTATKSGTTLGSFNYAPLAPAGNRTTVSEVLNTVGNRTVNYGYDAVYRLAHESIVAGGFAPTGTVTYDTAAGYLDASGYDRVGNRRQRSVSLTPAVTGFSTLPHNFDVNDRLDPDTNPANTNPNYDANGNTVSDPNLGGTFAYDWDNRLISRSTGSVTIDYDGDGNRVRKSVGGVLTYYLVDDRNPTGYAQVLEELTSPGGTPTRIYTYGHDLLRQKVSGAGSFYGYDALGSVRFLTDSAGNVTDTYTYDAFGTLIQSSGATANRYLYAGEQYDADLGLYYLRARYFNPNVGRFWTMDTFEGFQSDPLSLHKYVALHNDPVNRVDPSGHTDLIQTLTTSKIGMTIIAAGGPAIAAVNRALPTIVRGTARAWEVANRVVASGGEIVAWESRVMRATETGMKVIGRFRLDMVVRLPGKAVNTLIESKGVPWGSFFRNPSGWNNFIQSLTRQSNAFGQASQSASGVTIQERVIYFTSQVPQGAEKAIQQIRAALGSNYQTVLWGEKMLEEFLDGP